MADDKALTNLDELITAADADLLYVTDMSAATGSRSMKITLANIRTWLANTFLQNLVEDLTPQLGGDLDAQGQDVTNVNSIDISTAQVGGAANYLAIDADGHLTLEGDATDWEDVRVPLTAVRLGSVKPPAFEIFLDDGAGSTGVGAPMYDPSSEEQAFFVVQVPHKYKHGSALNAHVHWLPPDTNTGNVVWGIEYTWADIDEVFGNTTLASAAGAAGGTAFMHNLTEITSLLGTGKTGSSMILCRVYRDAADAADTYASDAALLEVDFHMQMDKLGSYVEYP